MGQFTFTKPYFVKIKDGLFLIEADNGEYLIEDKEKGTSKAYSASNGFGCYLDNIKLHTKTTEKIYKGTAYPITIKSWIVELHDETGAKFEIWFDERSQTFFGLINAFASITNFGYLLLTASKSPVTINGKVIIYTHLWVKNIIDKFPHDVKRKFSKDQIPAPEEELDERGKPRMKEGFPVMDHSKRIQFFADLIPGILQVLSISTGHQGESHQLAHKPQVMLSETNHEDYYPDMDQEPPLALSATVNQAEKQNSIYLKEHDDVPF